MVYIIVLKSLLEDLGRPSDPPWACHQVASLKMEELQEMAGQARTPSVLKGGT